MTRLGNLLIVGVQKAGTTSLHDYLSAHPEICGAVPKEPGFYVRHQNREAQRRLLSGSATLADLPHASVAEYTASFADDAPPWRLDSSTPYFQSEFAQRQIAELVPEAHILVCLRDPAARAYSAYNWAVKEGWETAPTFEAALDLEPQRRDDGYWFSYLYTDTSRYSARVASWRQRFPNTKTVLFDDLFADPLATTNDILAWLDLPPLASLSAGVRNPSGLDRHPLTKTLRQMANRDRHERGLVGRTLRAVLGDRGAGRLKQLLVAQLDRRLTPPPPLGEETRARLVAMFANDIDRLETMLERDLSTWRLTDARPDPRPSTLAGSASHT